MVTLKNISNQALELHTKSGETIRIRPRSKVTVSDLTPQMQNLVAKSMLKKTAQ
jgi:hypothetical protein